VGADPALRRVLFVGNLVAIKGLPDLLEAFRMASDRSGARLELVLVGEGRLEAALRNQARSLRIEPAIRFVGREARARVASWMAASDVLVLPSLDEGVPNVVLEALACGRPVVASAVGGIPEVHPGESAGALVSPSSPGQLAAALVETLGRSWNESALARLTDGLDWASNARKVVEAIQAAEKTAA
jgi:glycosyltransferase involved in cell wall biosynthesis